MAEADANYRMSSANMITRTARRIDEAGIERNSPRAAQISAVLEKRLGKGDVDKQVWDIAQEMKQDLKGVILNAIDAKVLTKERGQALIRRSDEVGYFPRVYDEDLLNTPAGKKQFIEALNKVVFSSEVGAKKALESILGEAEPKTILDLLESMPKTKDGKLKMSLRTAEKLFTARREMLHGPRSGHLERARKIPEEFDQVLEPFRVTDPKAVMSQYYLDVYKRIEFAKTFGAKDEIVTELATQVNKDFPKIADQMREAYWGSVGDANSKNLRAHMEQGEFTKAFMNRVGAFESLKLILAPIANMGQYTVNGSVKMANIKGLTPAQKFEIFMQNTLKGYTKKGYTRGGVDINRDLALRQGAAIESTALSVAGELATQSNTMLGRNLQGVLAPFNYLTNPTKFLKAIGFTRTEEINRVLGHNLGKALAEQLLSNKARILKTGKNLGKIKEIDQQLFELGINPNIKDPLKTPISQVERAGLLFTNEINFTNTPMNMPELWNHPNAKLLRQFKTFSFNHGKFIKDNALEPARKFIASGGKKGSVTPLMVYLGVGTPVGMSIVEFKNMIRGDTQDLTTTERYLKYVTAVGGLGIMIDTIQSSVRSPGGFAEAITGPAVSDAGRLIFGAGQAVEKGEIDPLAKQVRKTIGPLNVGMDILEEAGIKNNPDFKGPDFYKELRPGK